MCIVVGALGWVRDRWFGGCVYVCGLTYEIVHGGLEMEKEKEKGRRCVMWRCGGEIYRMHGLGGTNSFTFRRVISDRYYTGR